LSGLPHILAMTKARIFQPDKNAMQSGTANSKDWLFTFVPEKPYLIDPLMGWTGMTEMPREIRLCFNTKEEAVAYADKHRIPYEVTLPNPRRQVRKSYADNFKFTKISG
jgi:hypothetical protein